MEENKVVVLTEDNKAVVLKTLKDTYFAVQQLYNWIDKDSLSEQMKETLPGLIEYHMAEISNILGFDSLSAQKVEEKHAEIRKANEKIRELEERLGRNNPIEGLSEQLKTLVDTFKDWWRRDGFGYIVESGFTEYGGFEAKLGFSFHRHSVFSKTPVTDKQTKEQWLDGLKAKGYQIYEPGNGYNRELIDCPENRKLLMELIGQRFPSALVEEFNTQIIYDSKEPLFEINYVKVYIKELAELQPLETE